ncbi:hypothetical protein AZI87_10265 [Bdellovibrio bacteriovorus]|uniref:Uncharacterized protein n=1 Tax=Bdellovibrio bacteriovorus TaxID=959 RepID=A0A162H337_BDEBC|nr:hypothetical protein [Bdellovibrio bacteriovorus]KYG69550.1 hypothetical protein AZI87_10265 [Bdellovibrio bacteriovorus]
MKQLITMVAVVLSFSAANAASNCVSEMMQKTHGNRELATQLCRLGEATCNVSEIIRQNNGINYADAIQLCAKAAGPDRSEFEACIRSGKNYSDCN